MVLSVLNVTEIQLYLLKRSDCVNDKYAKEITKELKSIRKELEKTNKRNDVNDVSVVLGGREIGKYMRAEVSE